MTGGDWCRAEARRSVAFAVVLRARAARADRADLAKGVTPVKLLALATLHDLRAALFERCAEAADRCGA